MCPMRFRLSDAGTSHLLLCLIIPLAFLLTLDSAYGLNYTVTISIDPGPQEAGASITIDRVVYHGGDVVQLPAGLHNIKAYSPSAWNFKGWFSGLNLEIGNHTDPSTTLTVNGNGTLGARWVTQGNSPNGRVSVDPKAVEVRPGVTTRFNATLENYSNASEVFHPFFESGIFGYVSGENVTIDFGQSKTVIINATVPLDAKPGDYTATLYAVIYYAGNLSYSTNRFTSVKVTVLPPLSTTTQTNTTTTSSSTNATTSNSTSTISTSTSAGVLSAVMSWPTVGIIFVVISVLIVLFAILYRRSRILEYAIIILIILLEAGNTVHEQSTEQPKPPRKWWHWRNIIPEKKPIESKADLLGAMRKVKRSASEGARNDALVNLEKRGWIVIERSKAFKRGKPYVALLTDKGVVVATEAKRLGVRKLEQLDKMFPDDVPGASEE